MNFMKTFFENLKAFLKKNCYVISVTLIAVVSLFMLMHTMTLRHNEKAAATANIEALTDSIHYYKSYSDNLVAEKAVLIGDYELLKTANTDLKNQIDDMKLKKPDNVVYVKSIVETEVHDTVWTVDVMDSFKREFDFSNKYRELSGNVALNGHEMTMQFTKDIVYVEYTVAFKDNKVYVTSSNPYVRYSSIDGISMPHKKNKWSLGIGPSMTAGYDIMTKKPGITAGLGISLSYNILSW